MSAALTEADAAAVHALAARTVSDELVLMPIRHHSPACADQVLRAIDRHRPSVVLIEGPASFSDLVPLIADPATVAPFAVFSYATVKTAGPPLRVSGYYPMADYSPELVALRAAVAADVPVRFIDLELAEMAAVERDGEEPLLIDERRFTQSRALTRLAERLGCRDHEDLWERLFEADLGTVDAAEHTARLVAYCLLARGDADDRDLDADGTTAREAAMAWHIRSAMAERTPDSGPVLVVLGGFHAVVMPDLIARPITKPKIRLGRTESGNALIRYSFERLERLNGYSAGMTAPGWFQRLWQLRGSGAAARTQASLDVILDVARTLRRRHNLLVPTPDAAAAYQHTLALAAVRGHPTPLRTDLTDGIESCLIKGDADTEGALVKAVIRRVLTGDAIGNIPPGAGTPPLVADTLARLARSHLKTDDGLRRTASLDLYRSADHRATSRLLHGLALIGVPFAVKVSGPDFVSGAGLARLQERWEYAWSPVTEGALVEASGLGSTLTEAVQTAFDAAMRRFADSGEHRVARSAVAMIARACIVGLHEHAAQAVAVSRSAVAADVRLDSVTSAATQLALMIEGREPLQATGLQGLPELLELSYQRAIYLAGELVGDGGDAEKVATALMKLRELLAGECGAGLDAELYWTVINTLPATNEHPLIRGAATGIAYTAGRLDAERMTAAVDGHLGGNLDPSQAVAFTRGLLLTARETAWQEGSLLTTLGRRLSEWDADTFVRHLPELRLAFATLTPAETDRVAGRVAAALGIADLGPLVTRGVDEIELAALAAVSAKVGALLQADGLGDWVAS